MKVNQMIPAIENAIRNRPGTTNETYHLIFYQKEFHCIPHGQYIEQAPTLLRFSEHEAEKGFEVKKWMQIKMNFIAQIEKESS